MAELAAENRRQNYRLSRKPEHSWQLSVDDTLITKNIVDISASGIAFKAPASFSMEPGQTLSLNISLKPGESFECLGRILWSRSDAPSSHTMRLFGVKFEQLPTRIDAMIVQELYKDALKARWENPSPSEPLIAHVSPAEEPQNVHHLIRQIVTLVLIAAFFLAARIYEKTHSPETIEYQFNQGLAKKLGHF